MKKLVVLGAVLALAAFVAGCAPKATQDDCNAACRKFVDLNKLANPEPAGDDPVAAIEAKYQTQINDLQTKQTADVEAIDAELQEKLGKAKGDAAKTKLTDEYKAKTDAKAQEYATQFQALNEQKAAELKTAEEEKAKKDAEKKAEEERQVTACADQCVQGGTKKATTDCQNLAATLEAFQACK
jgi:Skp family chaperone for outer membrane proteins